MFAQACFSGRFWLTPFVLANVLIDCEVLYCLRFSLNPIHRFCHTYVGGTLVGAAAGGLSCVGLMAVIRLVPTHCCGRLRKLSHRQILFDSVGAGLAGGISHVFLDSLMHQDMKPLWPVSNGNPMLGLISMGLLHMLLVSIAFFGGILWILNRD